MFQDSSFLTNVFFVDCVLIFELLGTKSIARRRSNLYFSGDPYLQTFLDQGKRTNCSVIFLGV